MRCCRWARMAMATPTAPSTRATRHMREEAGGVVEAAGDGGAGLAVVGDLRVGGLRIFSSSGRSVPSPGLYRLPALSILKRYTLAGAAAEAEQSALQHRPAGDQDARAEAKRRQSCGRAHEG